MRMRRCWLGLVTALCAALVGVPVAAANVADTAEPRSGPPGTEVAIHWSHEECPGQLVAYLAETKDRPRLEAGHAAFHAPDDVFVIPAVPVWEGGYQILLSCPNDRGVGGFRFFVTPEPTPRFTG